MINHRLTNATKRRDQRGFLVDFLKGDETEVGNKKLGQIYFVTFEKKGVIRGNHYHETKNEWFVVVKGKVKVILEDRKTKQQVSYILDGDNDSYKRIFVPKGIAHAFINMTALSMMIDYADKPYHNNQPDTIGYKIIE